MATLASQPTVIQSLYSWYRENKILVNRRYQRKLVWNLEEKQKLIDSILSGYPIPAILLAERKDEAGVYEIIDGLQRLHAIFSFIENYYPTLASKYFDVEKFATASEYSDQGVFSFEAGSEKIESKEVSALLDYTVALSIMRNASEAEINDVFDRINTYGHRLSDQERRQAGVTSSFADLVRKLACDIRGDTSSDILPLFDMPNISIDLPKMQHGYDIQADSVFWVKHGILRSTDLRDSLDEQVVADIVACTVGKNFITRSKNTLDGLYNQYDKSHETIIAELEVYGSDKVTDEFKYVIGEIEKVCTEPTSDKLNRILFAKPNNNAFPSIFSFLFFAIHELIITDGLKISDYSELRKLLSNSADRLTQGQQATAPVERRKNVDILKGMISAAFVKATPPRDEIYHDSSVTDIENYIRRSGLERSNFELKQGILDLTDDVKINESVVEKVIMTICAMANIGPHTHSRVIIGVCDNDADSERVKAIDKIDPKTVGSKKIVGVAREAKRLGWDQEKYLHYWRDKVANSKLSDPLKTGILNNIDFNSYFGMGIILINVPPMGEMSFLGDRVFKRAGDQTVEVTSPKEISELSKAF